MFNLEEFILQNLISGVKKGVFAKEYASTLTVNYLLKGILTQEDIARFDEETKEPETEDTENETEDTENSAESEAE